MKNKKPKLFESKRSLFGYVFTLPFMVGSIAFVIFPIILSIAFSFSKVSNDASGFTLTFLGLENYRYMLFSHASYNKTVFATIGDMLVDVPVVAIFSFFIASLLNQEFKGRGIARSILFLPLIVSSPVVMQILAKEKVSSEMSQSASERSEEHTSELQSR